MLDSIKIYYSDSCLKYMNEGKEFGPNPPETSGLDAFLEAIKKSVEKHDGSYRDFFKRIPEDKRASLLKEFLNSDDVRVTPLHIDSLMRIIPEKDRLDVFQQLAQHKDVRFRSQLSDVLADCLLNTNDLFVFLETAIKSEYDDVRDSAVYFGIYVDGEDLSPSQQTDLIEKGLEDPNARIRARSLEFLSASKIPLLKQTVFIEQGLKDSDTDVIVAAIDSLEFLPKETQVSFQEKVSVFLRSYFDSSKDLDSFDVKRVAYALEADRTPLLRVFMEHSRFVPGAVYSVISSVPEKDRADLIRMGLESSKSFLVLAAVKAIDQADWNNRQTLNSLALKKIKV